MKKVLLDLLRELEMFGIENDQSIENHSQKMLNITHDTGNFLALMIKASGAKNILEIGTSNGYSTLWLADSIGTSGCVTTIEQASYKIEMAGKNFKRSGLQNRIRQIKADVGDFIATCKDGEYDFIFLDSNRKQYVDLWKSLQRILKPNGLLIVDNAISHKEEMETFSEKVSESIEYISSLVPIGKGELVILKE